MKFSKTTILATLEICSWLSGTAVAGNFRGISEGHRSLADSSERNLSTAADPLDPEHLHLHRSLLQPVTDILPSPATFFGGTGGSIFSHDAALTAGKITKIQLFSGGRVNGFILTYADGRSFKGGQQSGTTQEIELNANEHIIRVEGREGSEIDFLVFHTSSGRTVQAGGNGGIPFDTGVFPEGTALQFMRGRSASRIDAIAFAIAPIPDAKDEEVTNRVGPSFGGRGGSPFSDFDSFFDDTIIKIQQIVVHHGSRVDGLEVTYLTENGLKSVLHGRRGGRPSTVDFDDAALKDIFLRTGSRVDQITFRDTKGRSHGPFGGNGGKANSLRSRDGEAILSLFGQDGSAVDQLGAVFQSGAIDRVEVTGPFVFEPITTDVSTLDFGDVAGSSLVLSNCSPDSTAAVTGIIEFSESVENTESFSLATTVQTNFETTVSNSVTVDGLVAEVTTEVSVTVGSSFEETEEFGTEVSETQTLTFNTGFSAQPGTIVTGTAVYTEVNYAFSFEVPVNVFFVSDPDTAVPDVFDGVVDGVQATSQGLLDVDVVQCP